MEIDPKISLQICKQDRMQTTLISKGRMTLPIAVRTRLALKAGDHLLVIIQDDDTIILKRPPNAGVTALRGLLYRPRRALTVDDMDVRVAVHLGAKHRPGETFRSGPRAASSAPARPARAR